jgi:dihydrofolate synthase/folylpolyglutamate synthase
LDERGAVEALQARGRFGVRLGLGRTRALLGVLGDPHLGLRGALIAGTNGKGSVQALVAAVLRQAGLPVGQTPKPHLVSYRERIVVDGTPIASEDFAALIGEVLEAADRVPSRLGPPTEFELVTAAAFTWFARAGVNVGVVEVGLGGRLDATNVWDGGVAAITNVSLDHMEWLGPTVPLIAAEKAAIIKRGDLAVTGADGEALDVIQAAARRAGAPLEVVAPLPISSMDRGGLVVRDFALGELRLGLLGRHQAANAAVALGVLRALDRRKIARITEDHIRDGFAAARWPGRLELLAVGNEGHGAPASTRGPEPGSVDLLLDGAHNAAGAAALATAVDELAPSLSQGRPTLLLGVLADKEVERISAALVGSRVLAGARVVAVTVPGTPRALPAQDVANAWAGAMAATRGTGGMPMDRGADGGVVVEESADTGLERALESALAEGGPLVVAGSLYLVGHVRGKLMPDPDLPALG